MGVSHIQGRSPNNYGADVDSSGRLLTYASLDPAGCSAVVSFSRTADTNAYTANDVEGPATGSTAAQEFDFLDRNGNAAPAGEFIVTTAQLEIDISSVPSGMTSYRLYLYNVTPPSALGDNTAWDLPSGDRASFKGYVDLGTPVDFGSTLYVETSGINKQLTMPSGGKMYGYLVTNGGYTPASGTTRKITLHGTPV